MIRRTKRTKRERRGGGYTEADFQNDVLALAQLYGWLWFHDADSRGSPPGFPDLVLVKSPRVVFAELKTRRGKLRRKQQEWLAALMGCDGVETYLWRPDDWREVVRTLGR